MLCSFLVRTAQLWPLALHNQDYDFIFLPAYLIRLVEYQWRGASLVNKPWKRLGKRADTSPPHKQTNKQTNIEIITLHFIISEEIFYQGIKLGLRVSMIVMVRLPNHKNYQTIKYIGFALN